MTTPSINVGGDRTLWTATELNLLRDGVAELQGIASGGSIPAHYDPKLQWLGTSLKRWLALETKSFGLTWFGDSTGNEAPSGGSTGDWPYEFLALVAAAYPHWTVQYSVFDDATQAYPRPTVIQTGTAGTRYVPFATGGTSYILQIADLTRPTNIDFAAKVAFDAVNPAAANMIFSNFGAAGNRGFSFYLENGGTLRARYTSDGTTLLTDSSVSAISTAGAVDGTAIWVRVKFTANDGGGNRVTKFYTSPDGTTWTQLGSTVTTATPITLFPSTQLYEIGGQTGQTSLLKGKIYEVNWQSDIDSAIQIAPALPELWGQYGSTAGVPVGAPILHASIGCVPTKGLSYLSDSTRLQKITQLYGTRAVFMSTSHNDSAGNSPLVGANYIANWKTWITAVQARAWGATPVIATQNPRVSPAQQIGDHELRRQLQMQLGAQLGLPVLDGYQAFVDTAEVATYINADGIHPLLTVPSGKTYSGAQIWAQDAYKALISGPQG